MKKNLSALSLALLPLLTSSISNAEQLDEISVTALRDPTEYAKEQANFVLFDRQTLNQSQATSIAQAVSQSPNISIQGGVRSLAQKPNVRGLSGTRVVQVVDGVRQNFNLEHRGSFFLPPNVLSQIEVIKGPASTLWGSGALGGVVSVRSLSALDLLRPNEYWGGLIKQGYQSASSMNETQIAAYAANQSVDFLIQGFHNKNNDIRLGQNLGDLPYSGLTQQGGLLKAGWQLTDEQRVELNARHSINKQLAPANNEMASPYTPEDFYNDIANTIRTGGQVDYSKAGGTTDLAKQKTTNTSFSINYLLNPSSRLINAGFTLYHNRTKETENNQRTGAYDTTSYRTWGFNLQNASEFERVAFIYGLDFYQDHAKTQREALNTDCLLRQTNSCLANDLKTAKYRPNAYNAKANVWGTYLLSHIKLNEHWVFSPAVRFDAYKSKEQQGERYSKTHWSPSLTLSYQPTNWVDISVKYNEAFRAPSLQERYISGYHFGYDRRLITTFQANPDLKAEIARNKELNINLHWNNLWQDNDSLKFSTALFQNDIKDFINLDVIEYTGRMGNIPKTFQYRNVQNARLRGLEISGQYQTSRWSIYANYGLLRGKDRQTGEALENINADRITLGTRYTVVTDKFNIGTELRHYFAQKRVPRDNTNTYPSYTLIDLNATYAPKQGEWENLSIDFAIENLFDKAYTPAFALTPNPGRNIKITLGYQF